ncbi:hypothetical protein TRVL_03177 [Trypanosoma vivax]|nr:hypothetical protein TRVL_03177 [Trypanosoma vivax]
MSYHEPLHHSLCNAKEDLKLRKNAEKDIRKNARHENTNQRSGQAPTQTHTHMHCFYKIKERCFRIPLTACPSPLYLSLPRRGHERYLVLFLCSTVTVRCVQIAYKL